jgi:hypothetical protein
MSNEMNDEDIRLFRDIVEVKLLPFLTDDGLSFKLWVASWMKMTRLYEVHQFSCLTSSAFNSNCSRLLKWYVLNPPEDSLSYLVRALRMANNVRLGMVSEEIFAFSLLETWLDYRFYNKEASFNGGIIYKAAKVGCLCVNSFHRLKQFLETYPDSRLINPSKFSVRGDLKDWFLLPNEFEAVNRYDGAIRAVEFVVKISKHQVVDCDSVRAGMIFF